jgi:hypothetical protein
MGDYSLTYSSDLMRNYLQAEILSAESKLQALQTSDGSSLLFSVGTDDALYLTRESPLTRHGWDRYDISSGQIAADFPQPSGITCKHFASAQSSLAEEALVHLGMVLADSQDDHLYLSLGNSDADTSWAAAPPWTSFPFDNPDPGHRLSPVKIVNLFISEASDGDYIVVDVLTNQASSQPTVFRYYIDPDMDDGYAWHPHDLAADVQADRYLSCLGRRAGDVVDGLYTAGHVGTAAQFIYQPLYNVYNPGIAPSVTRFSLPGGLQPEAISTCRREDDSADVYVTAGGGLYLLDASHQKDGAVGLHLVDSPRLAGVTDLFATADGDSVVVWGLNASREVFYASCPAANVRDVTEWSVPVPIVSGAEQVAPYLDRANSASTFFCHTGTNRLSKLVKSPVTGMWASRDITLEPPASRPADRISAYTTVLQVTRDADGQPAAGVPLTITATNVCGVRINYLYYVIGPTPVEVTTDNQGTVTVMEPADSVSGTRLVVTLDGSETQINPMDTAVGKATSLDSAQKLTNAVITSPDGSTRPLVTPGTDPQSLDTVAQANASLAQAYSAQPTAAALLAGPLLTAAGRPGAGARRARRATAASPGGIDDLWVEAGDFFTWVGQAAEYTIKMVIGDEGWNLVASFAGTVIRCAVDCAEHIAAAVQTIINMVIAAVKDFLEFLEFLFKWREITRTKEVMANALRVFLTYEADQIGVIKNELDQQIADAMQAIAGWAGTDDWSGLGDEGQSTANGLSDPASPSAPGSLLSHHYQHNIQDVSQPAPPSPTSATSAWEVLADSIETEVEIIDEALTQLVDLAAELPTMSLTDLLTKLTAIITEAVLASTGNVLDAVLSLIQDALTAILGILDTAITIPVLSDVLSDFGVPSLTYFDVLCWVGAVPATLVYELAEGDEPFPDNGQTASLISAPDWAAFLACFAPQLRAQASLPTPPPDGTTAQKAMHCVGHCFDGAFTVAGALVSSAALEAPNNTWLSISSALLGGLSAGAAGIVSRVTTAIAPYDAIEDAAVQVFADSIIAARGLAKIFFSTPAQWVFAGNINLLGFVVNSPGQMGAIVDAILVFPALYCSVCHFVELAGKPERRSRSIAIVDETSAVTNYVYRIMYMESVFDPLSIEVMVLFGVMTADLQITEAFLVF